MAEHPESLDLLLEPLDNEQLANVCGQLDENLRQIERRLGIEINNRGNHFRLIGERHVDVSCRPVEDIDNLDLASIQCGVCGRKHVHEKLVDRLTLRRFNLGYFLSLFHPRQAHACSDDPEYKQGKRRDCANR